MSTAKRNRKTAMGAGRSLKKRPSALAKPAPVHYAPFDTLATEILLEIFAFSCPNIDLPMKFTSPTNPVPFFPIISGRYLDPMVLAMVCRRWRAITVAQDSLWGTMAIKVSRIGSHEWARWGVLQLRDRLERSHAHPLKISILSKSKWELVQLDNKWAISQILHVVILHSARWTSIDFVEFSLDKYAPIFASFSAPMLKHLGLWDNYPRYAWTTRIPWKQLTDVVIASGRHVVQLQEWHKTFSLLSVSLTALTLSGLTVCDSPRSIPRIVLPKLQRLRFLQSWCIGILDTLVCPSLETLDIPLCKAAEINRFLDRSSGTLIHIHLGCVQERGPVDVLQHSSLSSLRSITLTAITRSDLYLLVAHSRNLFPNLETLFLDWSNLSQMRDKRKHKFSIDLVKKKLQQILDSRTHGASVEQHNTFLDNIRSHFIEGHATSPVRNFSAHLILPPPMDEDHVEFGVRYM